MSYGSEHSTAVVFHSWGGMSYGNGMVMGILQQRCFVSKGHVKRVLKRVLKRVVKRVAQVASGSSVCSSVC